MIKVPRNKRKQSLFEFGKGVQVDFFFTGVFCGLMYLFISELNVSVHCRWELSTGRYGLALAIIGLIPSHWSVGSTLDQSYQK
jgi:hypothetical protein